MLNYPENLTNEISAYRLNENELSGYYPIGVGNFWHSGIHLSITSDTPLKPLISGKVIAYRIDKNYQTVSLPQKLTKEKLDEKYSEHKNFYMENDGIYYVNEKIPSGERKINLASNFILLEHYVQDTDSKNSFKFYTLYTNIGSSSTKEDYQDDFKTDGKIHILKDEEKFSCSQIGPAGYDRDEKYIEISCFMEKSLFDIKFNSKKLIFLSAENYKEFYSRKKNNCEKKQFYFTNRSHYTVKEIITSENRTAKKIQLISIAAYLDSGVDTLSKKKTETTIKENKNIEKVILNTTKVYNGNTSDYNLINTGLDLFFNTYKGGKKYTVTNITSGGQTQILIDCSACSPVWIVEDNDGKDFASETGKESIYGKNTYIDYYEECPLLYSFTKKEINTIDKIKGLTENICFDKNKTEYCEIDGLSEVYVKKNDFEKKCFENAFKWNAFFDNQEEFEDDIFCDKLSLLKKIDESSVIKNIFGTNRMISDDEMKMFFGPNDHSLEMKAVVKKLRRIECKHPLEFDKAKFEKIADEYNKRKEWTMGTMSENAANTLKSQIKIRDVWTDGLSKIFKKNNFFFVHPIYFLNHLDKAGVFEFNPYRNYKRSYKQETTLTNQNRKIGDHLEDGELNGNLDNPGFAPLAAKGMKGDEFPEYNGFVYGRCTSPFNIKRVRSNLTEALRHTGVDLASGNGSHTDIICLINGVIWGTYEDKNYGKVMLVKNNNENLLYMLCHLSSYVKTTGTVFPGDVVGKLGNTGEWGGASAHLHLEVREINETSAAKVYSYNKKTKLLEWKNDYQVKARRNAFNHTEKYKG